MKSDQTDLATKVKELEKYLPGIKEPYENIVRTENNFSGAAEINSLASINAHT